MRSTPTRQPGKLKAEITLTGPREDANTQSSDNAGLFAADRFAAKLLTQSHCEIADIDNLLTSPRASGMILPTS